MKLDERIISRLDELIQLGEAVIATSYSRAGVGYTYWSDHAVDSSLSHQWGTSCLSFIGRIFGKTSEHYTKFDALFSNFQQYTPVVNALGILKSAKEEYQQHLLFETRQLVQAEVFDDFLAQADHLWERGYYQAAAVIAGSVLEDGLRKLCTRAEIVLPPKPKLDTMNAELAKKGVYNLLTQKRITTLADLRNKAAHGTWNDFSTTDVEEMLRQVRAFMSDHFS